VRGPGLSATEFLIALTEVTGVQDATGMVSATWAKATEADRAGVDAMRHESWPGGAPIDVTALAAADFPKTVVVGAWDPAVHPELADMWASGWHQAVAAEHRTLIDQCVEDICVDSKMSSPSSPIAARPGARWPGCDGWSGRPPAPRRSVRLGLSP
jgi:hypothetical protein